MNALRQEAFRMMESMPDEGMADLIRYMNEYHRKFAAREQRQYDAREKAFTVLESMKRKVPELDYARELAGYREEKYL